MTDKEIIKAFTGGNGIRIRVDNMIVYVDDLEEWLEFCDKQKAEAIKEFAERLKKHYDEYDDYDDIYAHHIRDDIDFLLDDMVGDANA